MSRCKSFGTGVLRCKLEEGHEGDHLNHAGIKWGRNLVQDLKKVFGSFVMMPASSLTNSNKIRQLYEIMRDDLQTSISDGTLDGHEQQANAIIEKINNSLT